MGVPQDFATYTLSALQHDIRAQPCQRERHRHYGVLCSRLVSVIKHFLLAWSLYSLGWAHFRNAKDLDELIEADALI